MRSSRFILFALAISLGIAAPQIAWAKKARGSKSSKHGGGAAAVPPASELAKLKAIRLGDPKAGVFTWGMSPDDVLAKVKTAIEARYQPRIDAARADPGKQERIRNELDKEIKAVKASYTKFDGNKSGWDVSIIGSEFAQNNGESVMQVKEEVWTRYFFFFEDGLYKMFLAFNKDVIGDKSFRDFGKEMAAKYGAPREVYRDEKMQGGVKRTLDHFEWAPNGNDLLKLIDRSEFYGVYCLVLTNAQVRENVMAKRKVTNPEVQHSDALVDAVVNDKEPAQDSNEDIIDRVTGHEVKKPGEETRHGDIVVPSPSSSAQPEKKPKSDKKSDSGGMQL